MPKPTSLVYDGVSHNADWVASFKSEKKFLDAQEVKHLYSDKSPDARVDALKEVYALCRQLVNPYPAEAPVVVVVPTPSSNDNQGGE